MDCSIVDSGEADAPVWIALHGSGRDETDMPPLVRAAAPNDALIAPRGPVEWEDGHAFFGRNADRSPDEVEIATCARHLEAFFRETVARRFAGRPLFLYGLSNGAIMGAALLLGGAIPWTGAVLVRPMPPFRDVPDDASLGMPVLILAGEADPRRRPEDAAILAEQLRRRGALVTHRVVKGGHAPCEDDHQAVRDWLGSVA